MYLTLEVIDTIGISRPSGMLLADTDVDRIIRSSEEAC
jgi:hypothetical protein